MEEGGKDQAAWLTRSPLKQCYMLSKGIAKSQASMGQGNHGSNNESGVNSYQSVFKASLFTTGETFKCYPQTFWLPPGQSPGHEGKSHLGKFTNQGNKTLVEQPIEFMMGF